MSEKEAFPGLWGLKERVIFSLWDSMSTLYLSCKSCIYGNTALMLPNICSALQSQMCLSWASGFSLSGPLHSFSEGLPLLPHCAVQIFPLGGPRWSRNKQGMCPTVRNVELQPPSFYILPIMLPQILLSKEPVIVWLSWFVQMDVIENKTMQKGQSGWNESASMTRMKGEFWWKESDVLDGNAN